MCRVKEIKPDYDFATLKKIESIYNELTNLNANLIQKELGTSVVDCAAMILKKGNKMRFILELKGAIEQ